MIEDLALGLASGTWRPMSPGENSELERMAAKWRPSEPEPPKRQPLPKSDKTGTFDMGHVDDWQLVDLDQEDDSFTGPGCSIPPITGSARRGDRAEIDFAIRWADSHPNTRWYVIRRLGALGLHNRIPSWPEVRGSCFSLNGRTWVYPSRDGSTVECPSLGGTVNGPAGAPRG